MVSWFLIILIKNGVATLDIVQATAEKDNSSIQNNFIFIMANDVNYDGSL